MKIVIVGPAYPFRGGIAANNERLAKAYQEMGHEVEIHTFTLQYPSILFPGKTQYSEVDAPKDLNISRSFSSVNPFSWLKLGLKIRKQKPDLLLIRFWLPFMGPSFGTIARIAKSNGITKVVSVLDNVVPHEGSFLDKILTNYYTRMIDGFVSMSESVREDLKRFNKSNKPSLLNPHPLFDNFGEPVDRTLACKKIGVDPDTNYIMFFGFIRKYKGLDILLRSIDKNFFKEHNLKLIVAGEYYDSEEEYNKVIEERGLEDFIVSANHFIRDDEVKYYFSVIDFVVQPYRTATQSGVTQIAYQFDKPMVVTKVGGLPELVPDGKCGYLCEVEEASIMDGIRKMYSGSLDRFTPNVLEMKKLFSWEKMASTVIEAMKG